MIDEKEIEVAFEEYMGETVPNSHDWREHFKAGYVAAIEKMKVDLKWALDSAMAFDGRGESDDENREIRKKWGIGDWP